LSHLFYTKQQEKQNKIKHFKC